MIHMHFIRVAADFGLVVGSCTDLLRPTWKVPMDLPGKVAAQGPAVQSTDAP